MNYVIKNSLSKYFGGGASLLYGYLESIKDLSPTDSVVDNKKALFLISFSSGSSILYISLAPEVLSTSSLF